MGDFDAFGQGPGSQFNFGQSAFPWGAQAQLAYTDQSSFGVVESSKPPTDRDLKPKKHDEEKHHQEDEEEEGAHDIVLACGAEKGGMRAPDRKRVGGQ